MQQQLVGITARYRNELGHVCTVYSDGAVTWVKPSYGTLISMDPGFYHVAKAAFPTGDFCQRDMVRAAQSGLFELNLASDFNWHNY